MNWEMPLTAGETMEIFMEETPLEFGLEYSWELGSAENGMIGNTPGTENIGCVWEKARDSVT